MKFLKKLQDHGNDQTTRLMIFRLSANDSCFFDTFIFFPHPAFLSSLCNSDYFQYFRRLSIFRRDAESGSSF